MQLVKRLARLSLLLIIVLICVTGAAGAATQTAWFRNWLRHYVTTEANVFLNGRLEIGQLTGNLFQGVTLGNVTLTMDDERVLSIPAVRLEYNAFHIISRGLSIDRLAIDHPQLLLRHNASGWSIAGLIKEEAGEADREGPARPFGVDSMEITGGSIVIEDEAPPDGVQAAAARRRSRGEPVICVRARPLLTRAVEPVAHRIGPLPGPGTIYRVALPCATTRSSWRTWSRGPLRARSTSTARSTTIWVIRASTSRHNRIEPRCPSLAGLFRPSPATSLRHSTSPRKGRSSSLAVVANARSGDASVKSRVVVDASGPEQSIDGELSVQHLDLAPITQNARDTSDINAHATARLKTASLADFHSYIGKATLVATESRAMGYRLEAGQLDADISGRRASVRARASGYGTAIQLTARSRAHRPIPASSTTFRATSNTSISGDCR